MSITLQVELRRQYDCLSSAWKALYLDGICLSPEAEVVLLLKMHKLCQEICEKEGLDHA